MLSYLNMLISEELSQKEFEDKINSSDIKTLKKLDTIYCHYITSIPVIPNLKKLGASYCNISSISYLEKLEKLDITSCPNLLEIPNFPNLKLLYCSETNIASIPLMEKLEILYCCFCPNLLEIPNFPNLKKLNCRNTNITSIPHMKKLKEIDCSRTNIKSIPPIKKLKSLIIIDCPNIIEIPNFPNLEVLACIYSSPKIFDFTKLKKMKKLKEIECAISSVKFYIKNLKIINESDIYQNNHIYILQGRLYQNIYCTYELLIF